MGMAIYRINCTAYTVARSLRRNRDSAFLTDIVLCGLSRDRGMWVLQTLLYGALAEA